MSITNNLGNCGYSPLNHTHNITEIAELDTELNTIKSGIPEVLYGTDDLEAGVSPLKTGSIYLVYE